jgi:MFS family permease
VIGFAASLPTFFLAIPGGVLVEHVDKRKAVIAMQAVMMAGAFALAFLALTGRIQIWHLVLLSLVQGIASAFEITARQSMLIELVGRNALPNAIALQSTAFNLSRILGPALVAAVLLTTGEGGEGWIFLVNGFSFLAILAGLSFVKTSYRVPPEPRTRTMLEELGEGLAYLRGNAPVGLLIVITGMLGIFAFPILQQIPVLTKDLLGGAGDTKAAVDLRNSIIYTAQGAGAVAAAVMIAINNTARLRGARLLSGEAAFLLSMIAIPFSRSTWEAMALAALMAWGGVTQLSTMNTLIQVQVPNSLRGRVFSIYLWALQGTAPIGSLLIGWMTQEWSLSTTALICGIACLAVIGPIQFFRPGVRTTVG